jgi:hypothetical protein
MQDPILITGAARSGTSIIAGVIHMCGVFGGDLYGPQRANKKGMFENVDVRQKLIKPYLQQIGADPRGQYPLPDTYTMPVYNNWSVRTRQLFVNQGYEDGPWFIKSPKLALMWPVWNNAFPNAKWIIVRRRSADIANSCLKTGFMTAFARKDNQIAVGAEDECDGWIWWVRQHQKRFVEMINEGVNVKVVWPERMVDGDYSQLKETIQWLGLDWNDEVISFVEPKLWKARKL